MNPLNQKLNSGIEWYRTRLMTAPAQIQPTIDQLLKLNRPTSIEKINDIVRQIISPKSFGDTLKARQILKKLNKSDLLKLAKEFKHPVSPTTKKSQIIETLLHNNHNRQFGGARYNDPGIKAVALLMLNDLAMDHNLLKNNQKLPKSIQKAINLTCQQAKKAYKNYFKQTGGAIEALEATATAGMSPIVIGTAIGGILLVTALVIGLMFRRKPRRPEWVVPPRPQLTPEQSVEIDREVGKFEPLNVSPTEIEDEFRGMVSPALLDKIRKAEYVPTLEEKHKMCQEHCKLLNIPTPETISNITPEFIMAWLAQLTNMKTVCGFCNETCGWAGGCPDYQNIIKSNANNHYKLVKGRAARLLRR